MQYLVLLYSEEAANPEYGTPEFEADMAGYEAFGELAGDAIRGGDALWDNTHVRTIHHDGGAVRVTNGPFAESTEGLGGYYVLEAPTLDDVIELVRHIPAVQYGAAEVRPLVMYNDLTAERPPAAEGEARYLATMHGPETEADDPSSDLWSTMAEEHGAFSAAAGDVVHGGGALHLRSTATTVSLRDGELLVTDGPYSEAMEVIGGFYVLRGTEDVTADVAGKIPVNPGGRIELREIMELG